MFIHCSLGVVTAVGSRCSHLFRVFIFDASGFLVLPSIRTDRNRTRRMRVTSMRHRVVRSRDRGKV